jgi:antitoxin component YwqK of YwqJK toxin-antitoxin module
MIFVRCLFIISILSLTFWGCAPKGPRDESAILCTVNLVDQHGACETISNPERLKQYQEVNFLSSQPYQKILRIYGKDLQGNVKAYITSYHPNGQIKQYLEVLNGRAFGVYQEWYPDGTKKLETHIVGGHADLNTAAEQSWLFDGCSEAWDENGNLIATISYEKGELHGCSTYFHANGQIWKRIPFTRNQVEGLFEIFLDTGEIFQTTYYTAGKKNGQSLRFWASCKIAADEIYTNDLLNKGRYYDLCGNLVAQVENGEGYRATFGRESVSELQEYHHGILEGEVKVFDKRGKLYKVYHIRNGVKHGQEIEYYENKPGRPQDQPLISVSWYEGKIQGLVKTWYDNGTLESKREMSNNTKNGLLSAWYSNGSLMLIEEYDHDKLVKGEYFKKGDRFPVSQVSNGEGIATLFDADGNFIQKYTYYNGKPQD